MAIPKPDIVESALILNKYVQQYSTKAQLADKRLGQLLRQMSREEFMQYIQALKDTRKITG